MAQSPTPPRVLERYLAMARQAGCPPDQVKNFRAGGYVPQPKQLLFHAAARSADAAGGPTQVGFGGARGPGKSHASICQAVLDDCARVPGLKALFLRSVGASAKESFEDLLGKALPHLERFYVPSRFRIELPNGSKVLLGGFRNENDIAKFVGIEYDLIVVEELNLLSGEKFDRLRGSLRTSKPNWRPRVYATFNPGGIGHAWVKRRFVEPARRGTEADTKFVFSTVQDNAFVNQEYTAYLEGLTGWLKQAWLEGDWDIAAGQFFTTWRDAVHVVPAFSPPPHWRFWCSLDYGFTHYTVCYLLGQDGDGDVYVIDEHAERQWLPARHAAAILGMLERNRVGLWQLEAFVAGLDVFSRRHDGTTVAEDYAAHGITLTPANDDRINGAAEMLRRLGDIDAGIRPSLYISARCARLVECLPALQHDPHRPEDVLKVDVSEDGVGGDDAYDSLRYGLMHAATAGLQSGASPLSGYRG